MKEERISTTRKATEEDIPLLIDLVGNYTYKELHWKHVSFSENALRRTLTELIKNDQGCVIVATKNDIIVGYAFCFINRYFFSEEIYASDLTFYVKKEHRGAYIGKKIIKKMIDFAKEKGARELFLTINSGINVYETERLLEIIGAKKIGSSMSIIF